MTETCNVCRTPFGKPIFESGEGKSLTTMNKLINGKTTVYFCDTCQHAQTNELPDLVDFYANEYEINLDSEDDDQLYDVIDGKEIYRSQHQANVLMSKIDLTRNSKVLDYGSAKAPTLRAVCKATPEIEPYLFDVTDKYVPFWEAFPTEAKWATHKPDPDWSGKMDVVLSFYALEHIPNLTEILADVKSLLKTGGYFYFIVPDMYQNAADLVVADHVNHFSHHSLWHLLANDGFDEIEIDDTVHASAYVVSARLSGNAASVPTKPGFPDRKSSAEELAAFWGGIKSRITAFEASVSSDVPLVIYGAGIYGHFILSCLKQPERVIHFLDQNVYLHGIRIGDAEVIHPDKLTSERAAILVGLNPRNARRIIEGIPALNADGRELLFLS
ncbi:MAG: class I SAM-dependent methyltransferase [Pseudomonadota bacterium]